jgi:hypothetical protein
MLSWLCCFGPMVRQLVRAGVQVRAKHDQEAKAGQSG